MVPEAPVEHTENGLVPKGDGWYVLNAREATWWHADGRPAVAEFEGEPGFAQLGINLTSLEPGVPMAMSTGRPTRRTSSCSPARRC